MRMLLGLLAGVLAMYLLSAESAAREKPKVRVDESSIYYGSSSSFEKPAVVDVDAVYLKIPEYQEIREKKIDESSPKYLMLMRAATDKFLGAVRNAAQDKGYDLVGGLGSIEVEGKTVPEITSLVISKLP